MFTKQMSYILLYLLLSTSDINECEKGLAGCEHHCRKNEGNYTCLCNEGYDLDANGYNCSGQYHAYINWGIDKLSSEKCLSVWIRFLDVIHTLFLMYFHIFISYPHIDKQSFWSVWCIWYESVSGS